MVFQEPPLTESELEALLTEQPVAILSTHNNDGTIHSTPIWFKYDKGQLLFGTQQDARRIKNIKRNPNVTVVVERHGQNVADTKGAIIYGRAELDYDDVISKRVAIFEKYMPKQNAEGLAQGLANLRKPVLIRVRPDKMVSYDYAKDQSGLF